MPIIEAQGLHKAFDDGTVAVDRVDFEVVQGEVFGFLGRNGAGKTTTVRILSTLTRATSGHASVLGLDLARDRARIRDRIGLSLQQASLDPLMSGREHLHLIASLRRMPAAERRARTDELLTGFGLTDVADRLVATYTVGMRRRLDATLALLHRPELLFLDEPTTGLDPQSRRALWAFVRSYREDGGTVFLTTQYLDEADELCDRIAILDHGAVAVIDTPQGLKKGIGGKVLTLPAGDTARRAVTEALGAGACRTVGDLLTVNLPAVGEVLPGLLARLNALGVPLDAVTVTDPTIEEVFVRLTGESLEHRTTDGRNVSAAALARTVGTGRNDR
ncbi:ATP-binding cassette domain-containing protein [Kitasatospora sp. NPDC056327]|uniref:ATP-binding cassette domain-containing protein n=1 Tax=Kitasatospora sp. NPDC056327 TaxID=3345785 RepID=UPI0035D99B02